MADELRDLVLRLTADSRQLVAELRRVEGTNTRTTRKIEGDWKKMSASISGAFSKLGGLPGIGALIGGGLSVSGLSNLVTEAQDTADSLDKLSRRFGVSVKNLQEYQFAATQAGASQREFETSLTRFSAVMGETALGTGNAGQAFKALGIDIRDKVTGDVRSVSEVFEEVIQKLSTIESAAERNAFARKLLGRSGPAIAQLAQGMDELIQYARELGIALDEDVVSSLEASQDASEAFDLVIKQRMSVNLASLGEAMVGIKQRFVEYVEAINQAIQRSETFSSVLLSLTPVSLIDDQNELNTRIVATTRNIEELQSQAANFRRGNSGQPSFVTELQLDPINEKIRTQTNLLKELLAQRDKISKPSTNKVGDSSGIDLSSTALDKNAGKEEARKRAADLKEAAREVEEAQRRVNAVIEASFTPSEKLQADLAEVKADLDAGRISAEKYEEAQASVNEQLAAIDAENAAKALQKVQSFIDAGKTSAEKLVEELDELGQAYRDGAISADLYSQAQESAERQLAGIEVEDLKKGLTELEKVGQGVFEGLTGALSDFILSGKGDFASLAQSFASEFLQLGIKGFLGSTLGQTDMFAGIFGGERAAGGPISSGKAYLVGERGPELIVPNRSGYVIPNMAGRGSSVGAASASSGTPVYVTVNNTNPKANAEAKQTVSPSGKREIEILITEVIAKDIGRGGPVGRAIDGRLGVRPKGS